MSKKRVKVVPGDCNWLAKNRSESKVAGGNSTAFDKGFDNINWKPKEKK